MSKFSDSLFDWLRKIQPEKQPRFGKHEMGAGRLFADFSDRFTRYVPERNKWYYYNGKVWEPDSKGLKTMELCKKLADGLAIYAMGLPGESGEAYRAHVLKWQQRRYRETIIKDAASDHPISVSEFDQKTELFNCKNGTLDLDTFTFRPHDPADLLTVMAGVNYVPGARCPRWEQFIQEVMSGDAYKAIYLQKAMGYALTGEAEEECFFVLYGPTSRNGKSTAMDAYMKLVGGYGRTAKPETITQRQHANGSAPSEDLARLAGARVVNIPEPDRQMVLSSALVKTLTGNDVITARYLNENSFEFTPQFKLFINTNHLPKVTDMTVFKSGRVKVIPFERHFTEKEQDKNLKKKLSQAHNLSGILNWCLDGLKLVRERGLYAPPAVQEAIEQYQKANDKLSRFIEEQMEYDPSYEVKTAEAFAAYVTWCTVNRYQPGGSALFNEDMAAYAAVVRKRPKAGGGPTTMILGYRLRPVGIYPVAAHSAH